MTSCRHSGVPQSQGLPGSIRREAHQDFHGYTGEFKDGMQWLIIFKDLFLFPFRLMSVDAGAPGGQTSASDLQELVLQVVVTHQI